MRRFLVLFLLLPALAACKPANRDAPKDCSSRIVGGQVETGHMAVGALIDGQGTFCSGTLVAPTVVVTAAHCVPTGNANGLSFYMGLNSEQPSSGTVLPVASAHPHPGYDDNLLTNDIAVLVLAQAAGVSPIPFMADPMPSSWLNQPALFVGYGVTAGNRDDAGIKRSVEIPITQIDATDFRYSAPGVNTCSGDSGGPTLKQHNGATKLVGVTSWGDWDCTEFGVNTRVDAYADFIAGYVNGNPGGGTGGGTGGGGTGGGTGGSDDFCADMGWYGDGLCDPDCPNPGPRLRRQRRRRLLHGARLVRRRAMRPRLPRPRPGLRRRGQRRLRTGRAERRHLRRRGLVRRRPLRPRLRRPRPRLRVAGSPRAASWGLSPQGAAHIRFLVSEDFLPQNDRPRCFHDDAFPKSARSPHAPPPDQQPRLPRRPGRRLRRHPCSARRTWGRSSTTSIRPPAWSGICGGTPGRARGSSPTATRPKRFRRPETIIDDPGLGYGLVDAPAIGEPPVTIDGGAYSWSLGLLTLFDTEGGVAPDSQDPLRGVWGFVAFQAFLRVTGDAAAWSDDLNLWLEGPLPNDLAAGHWADIDTFTISQFGSFDEAIYLPGQASFEPGGTLIWVDIEAVLDSETKALFAGQGLGGVSFGGCP